MSVQFKPGGAFPFLLLPAAELHNEVVSLKTLWEASARLLRERLLEASTRATRFRILEQFLLARLAGSPGELHPAVCLACASFQAVRERSSIAAVIERLGLDHKRFIHLFDEAVGLTPKRFCRVVRFQDGT